MAKMKRKKTMSNNMFFLFWLIALNGFEKGANAASFYGSGHASLSLEDAQSTTDLSFRFRTSRAEALLVLVAGRTDYCLVMLQAGAVKITVKNSRGHGKRSVLIP